MSEIQINVESRAEFGKGGARRTRRAGKIPAVLYGHGERPRHIALPTREFAAAIRHGGANQLFDIVTSDDASILALPKAIQRDPVKDTFEHVDLLIVRRGDTLSKPQQYWDVPFDRVAQSSSLEEATAELTKRLREAVEIRLVAEVPLGAFLSGGVDSSSVVAMIKTIVKVVALRTPISLPIAW